MATFAENLAEIQTLQTCGTGFVAFVWDPSADVIEVKTPTPNHLCGTNLVFKPFHGGSVPTPHTAGHAEVDLSTEDSIA